MLKKNNKKPVWQTIHKTPTCIPLWNKFQNLTIHLPFRHYLSHLYFNIQSTLPKLNSHKSNNRLSRRSIQVLFSLYSIVFNPHKSNPFSKSKLFFSVPTDCDLGRVDCTAIAYSCTFVVYVRIRRVKLITAWKLIPIGRSFCNWEILLIIWFHQWENKSQ